VVVRDDAALHIRFQIRDLDLPMPHYMPRL
jgi:hypothetical protein